jgi:sirohydrochlorin ferrochelatase
MPGLVLCAHGTRDPAGASVTAAIAESVAAALPGVPVRLGYADVQQPLIGDLVASLGADPIVVVPLLLSRGYHVETDINASVELHPAAVATSPVGPDPRLAAAVAERLAEAGIANERPIVLGAAGSTRRRALADAREARDHLAAIRSGPVSLAFAAAGSPSVADAVRSVRSGGTSTVAVAAYLLAPGHFLDVLRAAGADQVTEPIGPAPQLIAVVADRYAEGVRQLGGPSNRRA